MSVARKELIAAGMLACRERLVALGFHHHEAAVINADVDWPQADGEE
jgi:hypothetical protein